MDDHEEILTDSVATVVDDIFEALGERPDALYGAFVLAETVRILLGEVAGQGESNAKEMETFAVTVAAIMYGVHVRAHKVLHRIAGLPTNNTDDQDEGISL